mmetsp:Transcript_2850/g.4139  ORF Transcript_2850/g.4139 Transcript_2850/m.4139 type:complete len:338 (+) Transcript_2850:332-1345(+)|eukprot:CAMPEP_0184483572 /NCGR_PEP_ID=MMETSP0113_2-20130426/5245_1 /TAXON_ID=91329 /ORGANISM="Norrisiella sphaerica, Strain BC52" /LENGTH=337 /DNA_ID=CAMNT_0026864071 /DNA_START=266 /DNA_END=1279 /DNA_ORIENTATION=-
MSKENVLEAKFQDQVDGAEKAFRNLDPLLLKRLSEIINHRRSSGLKKGEITEKADEKLRSIASFLEEQVLSCRESTEKLGESPEMVSQSGVDLTVEFLENIWRADKFLQIIGFGPVGVGDVLKGNGYAVIGKIVGECGYTVLDNRAMLRFWLFLYQVQKLRTTPRDVQIEEMASLRSKLESEVKIGAGDSAKESLAMLHVKLNHLKTLRTLSKLQAYVNLVFQPLDWLGWVSRSSKGSVTGKTTALLDRGACTCWFLVEGLELYATWLEYKYRNRMKLKSEEADNLKAKLWWNVIVRTFNMILAYNWTKVKPTLSDSLIGGLGASQAMIDIALMYKN